MTRKRVGVLISGRGSNLQALIDACADPAYPAEIVLVVSSEPGAAGLARAAKAGIAARTFDHRKFSDRRSFERAIIEVLAGAAVELVCLAGFMRILGPDFVDAWHDRLINIHPSLLPAFPGLDTHRRALAAGVRFSGCTVHFVRQKTDDGPIIVQAAVPVLPGDDEERLAARVLATEHKAYPLALRLVASGRARVVDERVIVDGATSPDGAYLNPSGD